MRYIIVNETKATQTEGLISKIVKPVLSLLPRANPDFERLYPNVVTWYLELNDNGKPTREIGIDALAEIIVIGPWRNNRGLWTDSPVALDPEQYVSLARSDFERSWNKYIELSES